MLIGKGGETVRQLSKDSGARIEISKSSKDDGPNGERTVYLSGPNECVDRAKRMIDETLSKAGMNNPNAYVMKVPHELVGMLIGKGGETIKDLKKESGARIDISKEPSTENSTDRLVHISGPPECVDYAKQMVEEMLNRARERQDRGTVNESSPMQTTIKVPQELIGMLIGKGGETIKGISKDSGARIEIAKDEAAEREDSRTVHLCGSSDSLSRAKHMIEDTLSRARERQGADDRVNSLSLNGNKILHVAQELVGMLIGRGGETIKAISRDTGARIEISKDDRENSDRSVSLSGSRESVDRATEAINDVLNRARERLDGRSDRRDSLPALGDYDQDDSSLVLYDRRRMSPVKESYLHEKVYVDEVDMPWRPSFWPEHEDGLLTDLEIFIKGLPLTCAERDLWEHLYRLGASDVKEILLLRHQKQSKGMAYVVFNRHDHAVVAKQKLNNTPACSIPCGGQAPTDEGTILVRFSESERCINGRMNAYRTDMVGLLLGLKGKCMQEVKEQSGLRKVLLTGRSMKSYGQVDEDPRMHLVVYYEPDEVENVAKAVEIWGEQLGKIHKEIVEKAGCAGCGKGLGKGKETWMGWPPMMDFPRLDGPPPRPPPLMEHALVEAPVLVQRRRFAPKGEEGALVVEGPKILEATSLRGRELRWQPWPDVTQFNEEWKALPLRWGVHGALFVLLRHRNSGETRVCAAQVTIPMERWAVLYTSTSQSKTAKYKSFTYNEHLFLISKDPDLGKLKVFHVPDPSSAWDVAFEHALPEEFDPDAEGFQLSRSAKLSVIYAADRCAHVLVVEPSLEADKATRLFKIADPGKPWERCEHAPVLSKGARLLPIYTKAKGCGAPDFDVQLAAVDQSANVVSILHMPSDAAKPWVEVSKLPMAGDTRLSCVYVPGKPEPLLMAGSPTERTQKLCHLNILEWNTARQDETLPTPKVPVIEEKFSRQMSSLWPEDRGGVDAQMTVVTPIDCTADLPVSRHIWVTAPAVAVGDALGPPREPPDFRAPFDRPPYEGWGPFCGHPPFGPRGPTPFDMRPPPFMRPPFDEMRPPLDAAGKGVGCRPPFFDGHPAGPFEGRPPFDGTFMDHRFPQMDRPERPPFDCQPGGQPGRPPYDAPPGQWYNGPRPPFDASRGICADPNTDTGESGNRPTSSGAPGKPTMSGAPDSGAQEGGERRRRRHHHHHHDGDKESSRKSRGEHGTEGDKDGSKKRSSKSPEGASRRHRRHHHRSKERSKEREKRPRSRSGDANRKERKRRHRSTDKADKEERTVEAPPKVAE